MENGVAGRFRVNRLRIASFGVRGFVGESLPPALLIDFAAAFGTYLDGGHVLLGRDTRYSSPMLHAAVMAGLLGSGCSVSDLEICPTCLLQYATSRYQAAGAVSISGGHNGMGWNAVTLIGPDGGVLEPVGGEAVLDYFHSRNFRRSSCQQQAAPQRLHLAASYFDALAKWINVKAIRASNLRVLIDPVGGAGCTYLQPFAEKLGFQLVPINAQPSGYLAREPEPRPRSALQMASIIPHTGGDAGFVLSSDMGRLSIVTESGEPASEEYTFSLIAKHRLAKEPGPIVTNIGTTRMIDDLARQHQIPLVKTRVGQAYIISAVHDTQAVLGGEGSGSVVFPSFSPAFDGFMMMALILEAMAERRQPLSALLRELPRYHIVKRSVSCGSHDAYRAIEALKELRVFAGDQEIDLTDGIRVDWPDCWLHVRSSRTQQLVRVIAEGIDPDQVERRADDAIRIVQQAL